MSAPASTQATARSIAGVDAFHRDRIGARHDHEVRVGARIDRGLDAIDHLVLRHDLLARADGRSACWPTWSSMCTAAAPALINERTVRAMLNAPPQPVSMSTSSGRSHASVMRRTSVSTSSIVLMPRSGMPSEFAATPPPER